MTGQSQNASIRVLVVMYDFSGGGAERLSLQLVRNLLEKEWSVALAALRPTGVLASRIPPACRVLQLRSDKGLIPTFAALPGSLLELVRAAGSSQLIVAAQDGSAAYVAAVLSLLTQRPAVLWNHSDWPRALETLRPWHRLVSKRLYRHFAHIISVSNHASEALSNHLGPSAPSRSVVYNALPEPSRVLLARAPRSSAGHIRLLSVGRLVQSKRVDIAIQAAAYLKEAGLAATLSIVGDGPCRPMLEECVREAGLDADTVWFNGYVDDPSTHFASADIVLMPSMHEGFGLVALEAAVAGAAVVAFSDSGGLAEIVRQLPRGRIVSERSAAALASAIISLLSPPEGAESQDDRQEWLRYVASPERQFREMETRLAQEASTGERI